MMMIVYLQVGFKMDEEKVKANNFGTQSNIITVTFMRINAMDTEECTIQMEACMMANGKIINGMDKAY